MSGTMFDGLVGRATSHPNITSAHDKADRIIDLLAGIYESVTTSPEDFTEKVQRRIAQNGQGTGQVILDLGAVPPGATWAITRLSLQGGPTTGVRLWLDTVGDGTLIDKVATDTVGDYSDTIGENPLVREGRRVFAEFIGQPAAQLCRVWLQVDQFQEVGRVEV